MRIPRLLGLLALCLALVAASASCSDDDTTGTDTTAGDSTTTSADEGTTTTTGDEPGEAELVPLSVYFLDAEPKIRVGHVRMIEAPAVAAGTLESLLAGPTSEDVELGLSSAIPEGTTLLGVDVAGGTATVDLSGEFTTGGGSLSMQARLAQVVFTLTQFPTVDEVELLVDGEPLEVLGGEGVTIDGPLTRADFQFDSTYEWLEPTILVETPRPGETVQGDSVDVGGFANTFEAGVYIEIVGADGEVLVAETYTMASAGTGTTGVFSVSIPLPDDATGTLVVRAYDLSGEDGGGRIGLTEVPFVRG